MGLESGIRERWRPAGGLHDDGLIHSLAGRRRSQEGDELRGVGGAPTQPGCSGEPILYLVARRRIDLARPPAWTESHYGI
jgi:hypothetical protein